MFSIKKKIRFVIFFALVFSLQYIKRFGVFLLSFMASHKNPKISKRGDR